MLMTEPSVAAHVGVRLISLASRHHEDSMTLLIDLHDLLERLEEHTEAIEQRLDRLEAAIHANGKT